MTTQYFTLDDGVLELHNYKVVIFDEVKRKKMLGRISIIFGTIYSISCIVRGFKENDNNWLYFGIFLFLIWTIIIIVTVKKA